MPQGSALESTAHAQATCVSRPLIALLFETFGPYHLARLKAARNVARVAGVELSPKSADYPWFRASDSADLVRVAGDGHTGQCSLKAKRQALYRRLDEIDPDVVAIPGWSDRGALLALEWCGSRRRPAIMMCDSTQIDAPRHPLREWAKAGLLAGVSSALASGTRSRSYLEALGLDRERIEMGYDVVDNAHFATGAEKARAHAARERTRLGLPAAYALFVGRLVEKKNVAALLQAFALYRARARPETILDLVVVGDGELALLLKSRAVELGVASAVHFFGHADYADLPAIYGLARILVLPSTIEQWGLVVNEALACGLPVVVSSQIGASADLVEAGRNGFVVDPDDIHKLAFHIEHLANHEDLGGFAQHSKDIAAHWDLARFAAGLQKCAATALASRKIPGTMTRLLAYLLSHRRAVAPSASTF